MYVYVYIYIYILFLIKEYTDKILQKNPTICVFHSNNNLHLDK